jgi:uncharacterized protein YgbK (DUF1537 family)
MMPLPQIRVLADDLTGALDTAAEFASAAAPVQVFWHGSLPAELPARAAVDTGTREKGAAEARAVVASLAPVLAASEMAFKKVDSLMRGQTLAELAACHGRWESCVFAPAFPYQGRITRAGQQYAQAATGAWAPAGPPLVAALQAEGAVAQATRPGAALAAGINVFDAQSDMELDAVVAGARGQNVLWCGTGGLARALAAAEAAASATLPRPILGLFGSDQATTTAQLAACAPHWIGVPDGGAATAARLLWHLEAGLALASLDLPEGLARDVAAGRIAAALAELVGRLPKPGTLVVAGGETLRMLCLALGAGSLAVEGRILPGLPRSVLQGGRWDGVTIVSKSGAFGPAHLLRDLLAGNGFFERTI